ncbi:MAG: hypothetical protein QOE37_384 [Microbacteriaceae bacterium]|nr:hypothetical protein [Microbacteriaceae bacterium]
MQGATICPGCGVGLPSAPVAIDPQGNASAQCTAVFAEVAGFEFQHPVMLRYHQLSVDAYGAQHGGGPGSPIRLAYSLAGLWLAVEHGFAGDEVRAVHQRMGKPTAEWPVFEPPSSWTGTTVLDVAEQGVRRHSDTGHAAATRRWAEDVWCDWLRQRPGTDDAVEGMLRRIFVCGGRTPLHGTLGSAGAVHRLLGLLTEDDASSDRGA